MIGKLFLTFAKNSLLIFLAYFLLQIFQAVGDFLEEGNFLFTLKASSLLVLSIGAITILLSVFVGVMLTVKKIKKQSPSKTLKTFLGLTAILSAIIVYSYSNYIAPKIGLRSTMYRYENLRSEKFTPEQYVKKEKTFGKNSRFLTFSQLGRSIDSLVKKKTAVEREFNLEKEQYPDKIKRLSDVYEFRLEKIEKDIREFKFERYEPFLHSIGALYLVFLGVCLGLKFNDQKNVSLLAIAALAFSIYMGFSSSLENTFENQTNKFEVWFYLILLIGVLAYSLTGNKSLKLPPTHNS
jgi:hypothetical protein